MNEKYVEALEQYELEIFSVRKGRGAWICETEDGCKLLKEYRGTVKRLEFEDQVLGALDTGSALRTERYVRNREGSLLSMSGDGTRYVLKDWFLDRECDLKDGREIRLAAERLAMLHRSLRKIPFQEEWNLGSILVEPLEIELERHNRELQRARNYIRGKRRKSEFELCVIGNYSMFYEQAVQAVEGLKGLWEDTRAASLDSTGSTGTKPLYLCHGDLDQHHMLMGDGYTAIIEYNRMHLGVQAMDLYRLMRKVMEKHSWNVDLGRSMLEAYERILCMTRKERRCLYYMFLYPEKYWKQINFYFNANKAWIPARNIEKLRSLEEQQASRNRFLEQIFEG